MPDIVAQFRSALPERRVVDDPDLIAPWTTDWRGRYHGTAVALLQPRDVEDVATILRIAGATGTAVVPQGGNSSMVGGATPPKDGPAVILSLRAMNAIRSIDAGARIAVCEAGVVLQALHEAAAEVNLRFPLTLGARGTATVGGLVSTNAGGTQVLRHGTMRALVEGIEAVLPDGTIYDGLAALKKDNRGYDLRHLLIGAEGTLGVVTAASLRLIPAVAARIVAWAGVDVPAKALELLRRSEAALGAAVEGFEVIAEDVLAITLSEQPDARRPIAGSAKWHVLIEAVTPDSTTDERLRERVASVLAEAMDDGSVRDAMIAANEAQASALWRIRDSISISERAKGPALQYDVSVPVATMPAFMEEAAAACIAAFPGATASSFGHLGDGNVHFHVRPPRDSDDRGAAWVAERSDAVNRFVNDMVVAAGGSISAEHGIGQMKVSELARLASPARLSGMRAIKAAFDPQGIMNPGKLVLLASPH